MKNDIVTTGVPTTSPVTVIQDKDMTTDIIACTGK